jgi:adenylosuccinate lyase
MIHRYARAGMSAIWSEERKLELWWQVERSACEGMAACGEIPKSVLSALAQAQPPSPEEVLEIERVTHHDVAAFVQCMEAAVGPEAGRFIHLGLTSSDILDTTLAVQLRDAADLLLDDLRELAEAIKNRALEHKWTPIIGRSHGIHAEPTTFGLVLAIWYDEVLRHIDRLTAARARIAVGKLSGAVGTFANVSPAVEAHVMKSLGLSPAPASNQVVQRDRHAELFATLALIASSLEKFAIQIRHWQRTEVAEAEEFFSVGQKGSSAMPHKRNPILSENVTGLARVVRSYAVAAMENVALWHERDISHSSVERMIGPDATITLDFALARLTGIIDKLIVYPNHMRSNLDQTNGLIFSGRLLVALIRHGSMSRENAYQTVQKVAMKAFVEGGKFEVLARADQPIQQSLTGEQLDTCFDLKAALGEVDTLFDRVFGQ